MIKKIILSTYYIIIPLLIIGISIGYTSFALSLATLIPLVLLSNRHTVGLFLLMYGGPLGGVIRAMYPTLPIYGILFQMIGLILMSDLVSDLLRHHFRYFVDMLFLLIVFGIFYLIGPETVFAKNKYSEMCIHGLLMLIGYYAYNRSNSIDAEGLSQMLIVTSICMTAYVINVISMSPGSLLDYNWFRDQSSSFYYSIDEREGGPLVGYQEIGLLALFGVSIFLAQTKLRTMRVLFYLACVSQLVLMSGCRQAILGLILVIIVRFVIINGNEFVRNNAIERAVRISLGLIAALVLLILLIPNLNIGIVNETLAEGDQGRMIHYAESLAIFQAHPLMGAGIGGYQALTDHVWPHNFFLELLSETGILGTSVILLFLIVPLIRKKVGLLHVTSSNMYYFLILLSIFIRVMFSADFRLSIELFSAVFAVTSIESVLLTDD